MATSGGHTRGFTVSLLINGTSRASCLIGSGGSSQTICTIAGSWTVNSGDTIALAIQQTAGTAFSLSSSASASASETLTATTHYVSLATSCAGINVTDCDDATVPTPGGSLTTASLTFGNNVPAGDTFTVTLYRNDTSTGLSCTIAATKNNCAVSGTPRAVNANDTLELQVTRNGRICNVHDDCDDQHSCDRHIRRVDARGALGYDDAGRRSDRPALRHGADRFRGRKRAWACRARQLDCDRG